MQTLNLENLLEKVGRQMGVMALALLRFPKMGMGRHLPSFTSFCFEDPQSSRGPLAREQPHMGASPWPASLGGAMSCPVTPLLSRPSSRGEGGRAGWRDPAWESCALHLPKPTCQDTSPNFSPAGHKKN